MQQSKDNQVTVYVLEDGEGEGVYLWLGDASDIPAGGHLVTSFNVQIPNEGVYNALEVLDAYMDGELTELFRAFLEAGIKAAPLLKGVKLD